MKERILTQDELKLLNDQSRDHAHNVGSIGWSNGGEDWLLEQLALQLFGVDVEFQGGSIVEQTQKRA